jgi:quinoprotein glucose dehydrogenase
MLRPLAFPRFALPLALAVALLGWPLLAQSQDWRFAGGTRENSRYSALKQVDRSNVARLQQAWVYDTKDDFPGSEIQTNPLVLDGRLYGVSPKGRLFALDAATGQEVWSFQPYAADARPTKVRNRGLMFYEKGATRRLYYAVRHLLYAVDANTGKGVSAFGKNGAVDLREGLGRPAATLSVSAPSPGVIYQDLLILGSLCSEDLPSAPGFIRAFDVHTGEIRWTFHTIPQPGEPGYETWPAEAYKQTGGANSWPGLTLDLAAKTVYVPTGSAAFDFYGGNRAGNNLYANSLLALDAGTGKLRWHFQFVHHDVWDRDLPTPPVLVTLNRQGKKVEAVAQATKSGHVFVFERATGKPVFPIEEVPVPPSDIPGEKLAETQPLPKAPPAFARQQVTRDLVRPEPGLLERFDKVRSGPQFTPPSREGTVIFPGFDGGAEWGGQAFDTASGLFYVNANEMPWILKIVDRPQPKAMDARGLYVRNCASCHRPDLKGTPPEFPSLVNISAKLNTDELRNIVRNGAGRMPAFADLSRAELQALVNYLASGANESILAKDTSLSPQLPFSTDGYNKFLDEKKYPAVKPPWGTLSAVNLNQGTIEWQVPLGEYPELVAQGMKDTGSENYGGPVVTAGGLVFIAATNFDNKIRAFDKQTGKLLWEAKLPAGGNATPAVYSVKGKQYIVIACGGGKSGQPSGGKYVAFALGENR